TLALPDRVLPDSSRHHLRDHDHLPAAGIAGLPAPQPERLAGCRKRPICFVGALGCTLDVLEVRLARSLRAPPRIWILFEQSATRPGRGVSGRAPGRPPPPRTPPATGEGSRRSSAPGAGTAWPRRRDGRAARRS